MIPRRIHLRNFLSYRECTADLTGLHLAVLCGRNGDGKTALLDGMTWALWGSARGRLEDDLIFQAANEMLVEFEFEVDGDVFAVVRQRTRGKSGALELLQIGAAGHRTPLTGGTMRETQAELLRRLRMDFDTFVNSAFIAQGRANEFTRKNAAERKDVFRKVLGLERYEQFATAANDRRKEAALRHATLEREAEAMRTEAAKIPETEGELAGASARLRDLIPRLAAAEAEAAELRQAAEAYERLSLEVTRCEHLAAEAGESVTRTRSERDGLGTKRAAAREVLKQGPEIAARYALLTETRTAEHDMAGRQAAAIEQERAIEGARRAIAEERARLEQALATLGRDLAAADTAAAALPELRLRESQVQAARESLAALDKRLEEARSAEGALLAQAATFRADAGQYRKQAEEIKAKETQLEGVATCPVCRQPLAPGELEHVRGEYAGQRRELGSLYRAALDGAARAETGATEHKAALAALAGERLTLEAGIRNSERDLHGRLPLATEAESALPGLRTSFAEAEARLAGETFALEARLALAGAQELLAATGYDATAHQQLRTSLGSLASAEEAYREHALASERVTALEEAMARESEVLREKEEGLAAASAALEAARAGRDAATDVTPRLTAAEAVLGGLRGEEQECIRAEARLEQQLEQLRATLARLETRGSELRAHKEEEVIFGELATAFGKNGVQAMLIDQSLPRLQDVANEMLDRMTGGRIQVTLHTQRQSQQGKVVETLDIRISDDLGSRDYDMYSGGEAFRVDFALRIALAKLLAERAGAALPTLIIDEGFGTQDQDGIDRLVEAINAIAEQFQLILVVTHIEELKDRFDRRIEVTKDIAQGSLARVV